MAVITVDGENYHVPDVNARMFLLSGSHYVTQAQAVKMLGITPRQLKNYARQGFLSNAGSKIRPKYDLQSVNALMVYRQDFHQSVEDYRRLASETFGDYDYTPHGIQKVI